jgi:hypothetical protein
LAAFSAAVEENGGIDQFLLDRFAAVDRRARDSLIGWQCSNQRRFKFLPEILISRFQINSDSP